MKKYLWLVFYIIILLVGCSMEAPNVVNNYTLSVSWKGEFSYPPSNPESGWAYYDTTKKTSFVWDGDSWEVLAKDGKSIEWKGELEKSPSNPEINWAYYNVIEGNSYIYTKNGWNYLAKSGRDGAAGIMLWLGSLTEQPANPTSGTCYYDINKKASYIWDGDSWEVISKDGTPGKDGADGTPGKDGVSVLWKGALPSSPNNPKLNWAYFNTIDRKSYIFDGTSWQLFSESLGGNTNVVVSINWLGTFSSAPSNPHIGEGYYNSTLGASYIYDGTVWQQISKDGVDGQNGITPEIEGYLINWKGESTEAPVNPQSGWAYYNTIDKKSYIYNGSSWQIIAQDGKGVEDNGYDPLNKTHLSITIVVNGKTYQFFNQQKFSEIDFGTIGINSCVSCSTFYINTYGVNHIVLTGTPSIQISGKDKDSFRIAQPKVTNLIEDSFNLIADGNIYFCPTSLGVKKATITIKNNSDDYPDFSFDVVGTCDYWPKSFEGGEGDGNDSICCSAEDSKGNLYFAGYGFELVNNHSGYDCWIKKFDNIGIEDTINWNKKITVVDDYEYDPTKDFINKLKIDKQDNVIFTTPYTISKYTSLGQKVWEKEFPKKTISNFYIDKNDDIYVTFENEIIKLSSVGDTLYSKLLSGNICFDNDNNYLVFNTNSIYYFNSDGSTKYSFKYQLALDNGWLNTFSHYWNDDYWYFYVKKGTTYSFYANTKGSSINGDGSKTGKFRFDMNYYESDNVICQNEDASYFDEKPFNFTASEDGWVLLTTDAYYSSDEGTIAFRIMDLSNNTSSVVDIYKMNSISFSVNDALFDNENNLYVVGYDSLNNNYEKKNARITKYNSNNFGVSEWNKSFDWNHCEDEIATQILFYNKNVIIVGNGNDIINGSSKNDTWVKFFDPSGTELQNIILDIPNGYILNNRITNKLYITEKNNYYCQPLNIIDLKGKLLNHIGQENLRHGNYLITDKYIYLNGAKENIFSPCSGLDWFINRYENK